MAKKSRIIRFIRTKLMLQEVLIDTWLVVKLVPILTPLVVVSERWLSEATGADPAKNAIVSWFVVSIFAVLGCAVLWGFSRLLRYVSGKIFGD